MTFARPERRSHSGAMCFTVRNVSTASVSRCVWDCAYATSAKNHAFHESGVLPVSGTRLANYSALPHSPAAVSNWTACIATLVGPNTEVHRSVESPTAAAAAFATRSSSRPVS